ncbi:AIR synthase family protein [Rosettibacter firmus]|uniref:AIR synthase family protein n=1 Tax=Rosettibacter firmus TaxID=3111522 RepID=UPI00336BF770
MNKAQFPAIGKISPEFFNHYIYPQLGAKRNDVLVPPNHGVDIGIVQVADNTVMAVTTDPIYIVPQYGWEKAAWFAWHILASDVTTSGFPPAYAIFDFNLPMSIQEDEFEKVWKVIHQECEKYGTSVITGHTARYTGTDYPMVGGATFIAIGPKDKYLTPQFAQEGDYVVITKGAAIEAVGIFSNTFKNYIKEKLGEEIFSKAENLFYKMSTVDDALTAVKIGVKDDGVTSMHDATECGVIGGVYEVAQASKKGIIIYKDKIPVLPEVNAVCNLFDMDPYISISEGTLVITVRPHKVDLLINELKNKGIESAVVGEILPEEKGRWIVENNETKKLEHPRVDPFWQAIAKAFEMKLN